VEVRGSTGGQDLRLVERGNSVQVVEEDIVKVVKSV
jgi:hypothetical protein